MAEPEPSRTDRETADDARTAGESTSPREQSDTRRLDDDGRSEALLAEDGSRTDAQERRAEVRPVPTASAEQPVLAPAEESHPVAPRRRSNRLVGTAWVLLAAGLFQLVYFGALALLIVLLGGAQAVAAQLGQYLTTPFAWLPVLFFFLLFELTVLIFNRAGRFLYVVASLVVGLAVYVLSVVLITVLLRGAPDTATLQQAFLNPLFVLTGLAAREVMLWVGVAIGARGTRLRKRNRAERDAYRAELAEA